MRLRTEPEFKFKSSRAKHVLLANKPTLFNTHLDKKMEPQLLQIHFFADPRGTGQTLGALLCVNFCLKEMTAQTLPEDLGSGQSP